MASLNGLLDWYTQQDTPLSAYLRNDNVSEAVNRSLDQSLQNLTTPEGAMDLVNPMSKVAGMLGTVSRFPNQFLVNTATNPNPLVGHRFTGKQETKLIPEKIIPGKDLAGSSIVFIPSDATTRGFLIDSVSDFALPNPVMTTGGFQYARDPIIYDNLLGYASNKNQAQALVEKVNVARDYNKSLGGSGKVIVMPETMANVKGRPEYFSNMTSEILTQFVDNGRMTKELVTDLDDEIRNTVKYVKKTIDGKEVSTKTYPLKGFKGIMTKEGRKQLTESPSLRKAFAKRMENQKYQKQLGYNFDDVRGAVLDARLRNLNQYRTGNTLLDIPDVDKLTLSDVTYHPAYDRAYKNMTYGGSLGVDDIPIYDLFGDDFMRKLYSGKLSPEYTKDLRKTKNPLSNAMGILEMGKAPELFPPISEEVANQIQFIQKSRGIL